MTTPTKLKTWKTIEIGTELNPGVNLDVIHGIERMHMNSISPQTCGIKHKVRLAKVSVAGLGLGAEAMYSTICAKVLELGHKLCPPELATELRLQYTDQPMDEELTMLMKPIPNEYGFPCVFKIERDDFVCHDPDPDPDDPCRPDLKIDSEYAEPDRFWHADDLVVFVLCN